MKDKVTGHSKHVRPPNYLSFKRTYYMLNVIPDCSRLWSLQNYFKIACDRPKRRDMTRQKRHTRPAQRSTRPEQVQFFCAMRAS